MKAACTLLVAAMALPVMSATADPANGFSTTRTYLGYLRGLGGDGEIAGPPAADLIAPAGSGTPARRVSIAELRSWLATCRAGAAGYGGAHDHPGRDGSFMHFECAGAAVPSRSLKLVVVPAVDGRSVEIVDVHVGIPMAWLPPAPTQPGGRSAYPEDKLPGYRDLGQQFMNAIRANPAKAEFRAVPIKVSDLRTRTIADATPERAADILRGCSTAYAEVASFSVQDGVPDHDAVRFVMKCDNASTADADLNVWTSITNGRVDGMGIQTVNDYRIPASSTATTTDADPVAR